MPKTGPPPRQVAAHETAFRLRKGGDAGEYKIRLGGV
jgi:hypothetical protein